jgi:hypothetical protein
LYLKNQLLFCKNSREEKQTNIVLKREREKTTTMGLSGGISAIGDKQRGMLMKLNQMREAGNAPVSTGKRRPYLASECDHVGDAEQYREQINREITRMIDTIQNPALDEHTLRDTNDEINRKFREKHHWNKRIYELSNGTIDYNKKERSAQVEEGDVQFIVGTNSGKRQVNETYPNIIMNLC